MAMLRPGLLSRFSFPVLVLALVGFCPLMAKGGADQNKTATADNTDQSSDPLKRPVDAKRKKEHEKAFKKEVMGKEYKDWLEQDVPYIITDDERKAFKQLSNDEERDQFIEAFWQRRNPNPDSPDNEFKEEHYRRIAYANEHFASGKPGWMTDRGKTYIRFGKPDEIDAHPSGGQYTRPYDEGGGETSTFPFEDWRYRYIDGIGQDVIIEFVDTCMCNDYHMSNDRAEKDALLLVPNAGLTTSEQMGLSTKGMRFNGTNRERLGVSPNDPSLQAKVDLPAPIDPVTNTFGFVTRPPA